MFKLWIDYLHVQRTLVSQHPYPASFTQFEASFFIVYIPFTTFSVSVDQCFNAFYHRAPMSGIVYFQVIYQKLSNESESNTIQVKYSADVLLFRLRYGK